MTISIPFIILKRNDAELRMWAKMRWLRKAPMWETSRSDPGCLPRGQALGTWSRFGQRRQTPITRDLFLLRLILGGHLDNSTQWIISPSYLLREFCTFEGYVILEIKLNARLRWAHLACRWRLATGAERRDAARARPWEQMALKRIVQVQCMEIIHLDEQMKSADLLLQSFEDNERFLCIRLEACDPKGHFALSVLSRQPVKDGWSEPSVRSGIQETPAGS